MKQIYNSVITSVSNNVDARFIVFIPSLLSIVFAPEGRIVRKVIDVLTLLHILWVIHYASKKVENFMQCSGKEKFFYCEPRNRLQQALDLRQQNIGNAHVKTSLKRGLIAALCIFVSIFILWWARSQAFLLDTDGIVFSDSSIVLFAFWSSVKAFLRQEPVHDSRIWNSDSSTICQNCSNITRPSPASLFTRPSIHEWSRNVTSHSGSISTSNLNPKCFNSYSLKNSGIYKVSKRSDRYMSQTYHKPSYEISKKSKKLPLQALFETSLTPCVSQFSTLASCTTYGDQNVFQQSTGGYQPPNKVAATYLAFSSQLHYLEKEKYHVTKYQYLLPNAVNESMFVNASVASEAPGSSNCIESINHRAEEFPESTTKISCITNCFKVKVTQGAIWSFLFLLTRPIMWISWIPSLVILAVTFFSLALKLIIRVLIWVVGQVIW